MDGASSIEAPSDQATDHEEPDSIAPAELSAFDLPRNGLTPAAIAGDTLADLRTQNLFRSIVSGGLTVTSTLSFRDRLWIADNANVRSLMKYIVSCALDPGVSVNTGMFVGGSEVSWHGHLGLCGARAEAFGDWATAVPSPACLEMVSSCVLASVNAHEKQVVISMRDGAGLFFPLQSRVPIEEEYRENDGTPIWSFQPCDSPAVWGDPLRDCAWEGRYVGSCTPDTQVTLQVDGPAMMRVCRGIYGCDHEDTPVPLDGAPGYYTPPYAGVILSTTDFNIPVTFTCPSNGVSPLKPSYFAVMLASFDPYPPGADLDDAVDAVLLSDPEQYPSSEQNVFTYREGAFFGNIFDAVNPTSPGDVLVGYQYACYSNIWNDGIAHITDRLCTLPDGSCFENPPERCSLRCLGESSGPQPFYTGCGAEIPAKRTWNRSITVYLNHPCDLSGGGSSCGISPNAFTP